MTISPKLSMWLNIGLALLALLGSGTTLLWPSYIPVQVVKDVSETSAFLLVVFNAVLHGYASPQQGPLVPPTSTDKVLP